MDKKKVKEFFRMVQKMEKLYHECDFSGEELESLRLTPERFELSLTRIALDCNIANRLINEI